MLSLWERGKLITIALLYYNGTCKIQSQNCFPETVKIIVLMKYSGSCLMWSLLGRDKLVTLTNSNNR